MANPYFAPGEQRASKVQSLFDRIARRYDLINDLQSFGLHRVWKRRVLKLASLKPGLRALDVCCGTGDLALGLASSGASVIGLDFSRNMIEVAANRHLHAHSEQTSLVRFIIGDAQRLPFRDCTFNTVTIGYGLRNLPNWETGLNEIQRILKPGGEAIILEFGKPANRSWRAIYFAYLKLCVPILGAVFCRDSKAYSYILESLKHYPGQFQIADYMRSRQWSKVNVQNLLGGVMSINYGERSGSD